MLQCSSTITNPTREVRQKLLLHSDLTEQPIGSTVYTEHNDGYLAECLENLHSKAIEIQG